MAREIDVPALADAVLAGDRAPWRGPSRWSSRGELTTAARAGAPRPAAAVDTGGRGAGRRSPARPASASRPSSTSSASARRGRLEGRRARRRPVGWRGGGSVLGDKTRMAGSPSTPTPTSGPRPPGTPRRGGPAHPARPCSSVEAAGYDVVLVETVGVGQSEMHRLDDPAERPVAAMSFG